MNESDREAERWRGRVDERLGSIEKDGERRERKQDDFARKMLELHERIERKVDNLSGTQKFARGALYILFPLIVFMGMLLLNHLLHHDIAVVPTVHAEESHANSGR